MLVNRSREWLVSSIFQIFFSEPYILKNARMRNPGIKLQKNTEIKAARKEKYAHT
jgi:hypothetical protein